jgi:hypothetical protein
MRQPDDTYVGFRINGEAFVQVRPADGEPLPLWERYDLALLSERGFEWGYSGAGPAQLALALIADATGDGALAKALHRPFMSHWVMGQPHDGWKLPVSEVRAWAETLQQVEHARAGGF